jgi:argininosuccinate lyase
MLLLGEGNKLATAKMRNDIIHVDELLAFDERVSLGINV